MEFNSEFIEAIYKKIVDMTNNDNTLKNVDDVTMLEKLLSIYNCMNNIMVQNQQLEMFKQSQNMMKDIDFSKVDVNGFLNKFMGK